MMRSSYLDSPARGLPHTYPRLFLRLIPSPERDSLKKVCSWCGIVIYTGSVPDAVITHSICAICVAKIEEQMAEAERAKDATKTET